MSFHYSADPLLVRGLAFCCAARLSSSSLIRHPRFVRDVLPPLKHTSSVDGGAATSSSAFVGSCDVVTAGVCSRKGGVDGSAHLSSAPLASSLPVFLGLRWLTPRSVE